MNLNQLNEKQRQAVLYNEGPVMILAGAGSGKTRTLVAKIAYILDEMDVSPFELLALTFSNKAAKEMRERIAQTVDCDIGALQVTTFHAFCSKLLRSEATHLGLSRNFTIYDKSESKTLVKNVLARHGVSQKEVHPAEVLYFIDDIKNFGFYPGRANDDEDFEVDTTDPFYQFYLDYESEIHRANALDFGGLITGVLQLFENVPDVLTRYQNRYKFILVDEYQDTNRAQFDLIKHLCQKNSNICVVGDEDQSIYSWRGADIRNVLDFEKFFPSAQLIKLERNYRSSKNIIEAASCVISRNQQRKGKKLWTENPTGELVDIVECQSDKSESQFIVEQIKKLKSQGVLLDNIAVFYRTNAQSRLIEDHLRQANLNYRIVGGIKFYERKEIKDALAYLRLIVNGKDSLAVARIINVPARGIGATTLRKLEGLAVESNCSLWESLLDLIDNPEKYTHIRLTTKVKKSIDHFIETIQEAQYMARENEKPHLIYEKILDRSGYFDWLQSQKDIESQARLENLQELSSALKQFEINHRGARIDDFLETVTLDTEDETLDESEKGQVSLMTIHGAKGLEFPHVFVSGVEENLFPSFKSLEENEQGLEEERRLFYVAMTRAMKKLTLTFAQGRMLFGQLKFNGPSRFLHEIPEKFYEWKKQYKKDRDDFSDQYNSWNQDEDEDIINVTESENKKFPQGSRVVHSLYGKGKVLVSDGLGDDEKIVVKFTDGVKKKFLVKFAPIFME